MVLGHPRVCRRRHNRPFIATTLLGVLVLVTTVAPQEGRANSGFIETIGISTAVGTVLGASTLPFYSEPADHMVNLAIGAGAGLVTGLGIWLFGRIGGTSAEKFSASNEIRDQFKKFKRVSEKASSAEPKLASLHQSQLQFRNLPYPKAPPKGLFGRPVWIRLLEVNL